MRSCSGQEMGTEGRAWPWQVSGESRDQPRELLVGRREDRAFRQRLHLLQGLSEAARRGGGLGATKIPLSSWSARGWGKSTVLPAATVSSWHWAGGADGGGPCQGWGDTQVTGVCGLR